MKVAKIVLTGLVVIVGGGFYLSYIQDPLGQSPVLDARENVALAESIAEGEWPSQPLYRAILYPVFLSIFWAMGGAETVPLLASFAGLLFHFLNAILVACLAAVVWKSRGSVWCSGFLYGIYPVALYFSVQILDITLGITFFLLALNLAVMRSKVRMVRFLAAGFALGIAVLIRPHFLIIAPVLILAPWVLENRGARIGESRIWCVLTCAFGVIAPLIAQGAWNFSGSGDFRLLPWQGAYNLYSANRMGADGRYYEQKALFQETRAGENTARRESELFYQREVGNDAPMNPSAMNRFWIDTLGTEIRENPSAWMGLVFRKAYYLLHHWEAYNNLSYHFQSERFVVLAWNPLGWTVILALALSSLIVAFPLLDRREAAVLLAAGAIFAVGVLVFYVSARFRLPLASLLIVASAGWFAFLERSLMRGGVPIKRLVAGICAGAGISFLSLSNFANAYDTRPFVQDEILLSTAALNSGQGKMALQFAKAAMQREPENPIASRLLVAAALLQSSNGDPLFSHEIEGVRRALTLSGEKTEVERIVIGLLLWQQGYRERAVDQWASAGDSLGQALAFRASGDRSMEIQPDPQMIELADRLLLAWEPNLN